MRQEATYDTFGLAHINASKTSIENNLRFPGQYYDKETQLHHNYFRDYDPKAGRYIQSDPIGLDGGINTFVYVGGNPNRGIDPLGLTPTDSADKRAKRQKQINELVQKIADCECLSSEVRNIASKSDFDYVNEDFIGPNKLIGVNDDVGVIGRIRISSYHWDDGNGFLSNTLTETVLHEIQHDVSIGNTHPEPYNKNRDAAYTLRVKILIKKFQRCL